MNDLNHTKKYNLEERTAQFGEDIIEICKKLNENAVTRPLISQLIRASTSVGANYKEANSASSKKDFRNKIYICKKEVEESQHWLRMITKATSAETTKLLREAQELTLIFGKIVSSLNKSNLSRNS